jgi:hypothetical protein
MMGYVDHNGVISFTEYDDLGRLNGGNWGDTVEAGVGVGGAIFPGAIGGYLGPAGAVLGVWGGGTWWGAILGCVQCH